jgi:hypothetical protein
MAKPAKYTKRRTARFMDETDEQLVKYSSEKNLNPAVYIRILVERGLKQDAAQAQVEAQAA